jgi:hypothetical protein
MSLSDVVDLGKEPAKSFGVTETESVGDFY